MKIINRNSKVLFRLLCFILSAMVMLGTVPAFAGAKATLQGGSVYFDQLIATKQEKVIRTKVTGNKAADVTQDINVEYIQPGSSITLTADEDFNGTIVGTITRHEYNNEGTRIANSTIEATVSTEIYDGKTDAAGLSAGESINISFDNESIPGIILGDTGTLYELQLLFSPKNQKPFFYTYYLRLDGTVASSTEIKKTEEPKNDKAITKPEESETPTVSTTDEIIKPDTNTSTPPTQNQKPAISLPAQTTPTKTTNSAAKQASPASTKISVDGKLISCEVYNIGDYNYFKLRDFAQALNGTDKSFSVTWLKDKNCISINTRSPYISVGGELAISENYKAGSSQNITAATSTIIYDNAPVQLKGYMIKGNSFFMVRDLAKLIDVNVTYDAASDTMNLDTKTLYQ